MNIEDVQGSNTPDIDAEFNLIDPDPFGIAFAIMGVIFAGGCYLETRRNRQFLERQAKEELRKVWYNAKRTLIHAKRVIEEFATHVHEESFGEAEFLFGKIHLTIDPDKSQQLRRIHGNAQTTAAHMADDLDNISSYLNVDYQPQIDAIQNKLSEQTLPHSYDAVLILARDAIDLYEKLIDDIGANEGFE